MNQQMTAVFDAETNRAYPKLLGATAMVAALHLDVYRELRRLQGQVFRLWEGVAIAAHRLDTDPDGAMEALRDCLPIAMELEGMLGPELEDGWVRGWRGGGCSVSSPSPSNRACGSPAHGSPMSFTGGVRPEPARTGWAWGL